jgi:aspartyl-tRNA(Asn)/glutamyl-tRNA(Gln) amidotransferase subunit C
MSDGLPTDEIARAARLARLTLTEDEQHLFARQLAEILGYVEQIQSVDTAGVEPMSHPHAAGLPERADDIRPSLDRDAVLDRAPDADRAGGYFKVPRVLGS